MAVETVCLKNTMKITYAIRAMDVKDTNVDAFHTPRRIEVPLSLRWLQRKTLLRLSGLTLYIIRAPSHNCNYSFVKPFAKRAYA